MKTLIEMYEFRYCTVRQTTAGFRSVFWSKAADGTETSDSGTVRNAKCQIVNLHLSPFIRLLKNGWLDY